VLTSDPKTVIQPGPYREVLIVRLIGTGLLDVEPDVLRDLALVGGFRVVNLRRSAAPAGFSAPPNSRWYQGWVTADIGARPLSDLGNAVKGGALLGAMAGWLDQQQLDLTWNSALSAGYIGSTLTKQVSGVVEEGTAAAQKAAEGVLASVSKEVSSIAQQATSGATEGILSSIPWGKVALGGAAVFAALYLLKRSKR
jgi:hypothetical protein